MQLHTAEPTDSGSVQEPFFDVIIVGAGLSGIGAAYHLQERCDDKSFAILEARSALGGTWDLFRYPGVRSDSDMHTLAYSFKPWLKRQAIVEGEAILAYLRQAAIENDLERHIRYQHRLVEARWASPSSTWHLSVETSERRVVTYRCNFLFMCSGYFGYKAGYEPRFQGSEDFAGRVIHPQKWPEDLEYRDRDVVVIGSGATAITLLPALARDARHVTMLQRSPTWIVSRPSEDKSAGLIKRLLPERLAHVLIRSKNVRQGQLFYALTRRHPASARKQLLSMLRKELGDAEVAANFTPKYDPWDQRLCLVPDGDFLEALRHGKGSVVTGEIDRFTSGGILLKNGTHLDADIIVTATGLQLVTLGEAKFFVDGTQVDFSNTFTYKGLAYSGVPNLVSTFGYINASWTLRADLTARFVCRMINHMSRTGTTKVVPCLRSGDAAMPKRPWVSDFSSGYMQRMFAHLPKQGDRDPWLNPQIYSRDKKSLRRANLEDGVLVFSTPGGGQGNGAGSPFADRSRSDLRENKC